MMSTSRGKLRMRRGNWGSGTKDDDHHQDGRLHSQPTKISIGVMIDSISKGETKRNYKDAVQVVEKLTSSEPTPSNQVPRQTCPGLNMLEKASAVNMLKFSAGRTGLEYNEHMEKYLFTATHFTDTGKVYNEEHVENTIVEKEQTQDRDKKIETVDNKTLRMKLWEVLGNVSSPNKQCPNSQSVKLYQDKDGDGKPSPAEERNLNFDNGASSSKKDGFRRINRPLTQKNIYNRNQVNKIEARKTTCQHKVSPQKKIFLLKEDCHGRLCDKLMEGSLTSKRNKVTIQGSGMGTHQGCNNNNAEKKQQSDNKSRSIPIMAKPVVHRNKLVNANSLNDTKNVFNLPTGKRKDGCIQSLHTVTNEKQKDVEQLVDVNITNLEDKQKDNTDSLLKNNGTCEQDTLNLTFAIDSPGYLTKIKQGKSHGHRADKATITEGIRSFKSLLSSRSTEGKADVQSESLDGSCSHHMKPSGIMEGNRENQMSSLPTSSTDTGNLRNDLDIKGCRIPELLSPEVCFNEKHLSVTDKNLKKEDDAEMTGISPELKSFKGTADDGELQIYSEMNHEDGFASAVALLNVALHHIKAKLESVSDKKSSEILWAAAEEIILIFQNAESQINRDVGRLIKFSQSKRKRFENKFEAQQEQLFGIYKRFKDDVNQHLKDCRDITEDLEEHARELERNLERQRAAHTKIISQVEQEIKVQLDDAEKRILSVHELANKKMCRLKLVVAESMKNGAFG